MMNIPITISLKGNPAELDRDLFGLGEKIDPKITKGLPLEGEYRYVNQVATITDGVTITQAPSQIYEVKESLETNYVDYLYLIKVGVETVALGELAYKITNWLIDKTKSQNCKVVINGKEITNRDEFQSTIDDFLGESKSNN